jgi:hypothetical protein
VEDLYPENLAKIAVLERLSQRTHMDANEFGEAEVEVDESRIFKCDIDDFLMSPTKILLAI